MSRHQLYNQRGTSLQDLYEDVYFCQRAPSHINDEPRPNRQMQMSDDRLMNLLIKIVMFQMIMIGILSIRIIFW